MVVAKLLAHSTTRMVEIVYGHLSTHEYKAAIAGSAGSESWFDSESSKRDRPAGRDPGRRSRGDEPFRELLQEAFGNVHRFLRFHKFAK